ncbi:MAG TPA: ABC transporter permease, partial [Rhodanobacter sp.]|nr:ABC transporter permease [Rhodanobacter sp.]
PVRTLLSVLAIAVEVTMILTLVGVSHGTIDSQKDRARAVGADIVVRPKGTSVISGLSSAPMSDKYLGLLMQQPHVAAVTGTVVQALTFPDSVTGIDFPAFNAMSGGFRYIHGGDPVRDDDMVVDEDYAAQHHLGVGSHIRLIAHDWNIAGVAEGGKLARVAVKLKTLQNLTGAQGHLTMIWVKLDDSTLADKVAQQLKGPLDDDQIYSINQLMDAYSISNLGMLKAFIGVVITVATIVGFIVVFMAMYTAVLERTREIGIIKAVGGGSGLVLGILLRETLMLAVLGTALGIGLTYGTQWLMKHSVPASLVQETVYDWWLYAGLIAIVGAMLGAIVPGYKAVQQDVTEALSYE